VKGGSGLWPEDERFWKVPHGGIFFFMSSSEATIPNNQ
jgi:hypothetical protein